MSRSSPRIPWVVLAVILIVLLAAASIRPATAEARDAGESTPAHQGILVELFTSQGCSSCPPADRFLTELAAREDLEVIALSFHVDYWNYIGWTDPFSSAAWSQRQRRYARVFGGDRIYTPQMVIDGRWEAVGSSRGEVSRLLERARSGAGRPAIDLSAEIVSNGQLRIDVLASRTNTAFERDRLAVWVAIVESDLVTPVRRGENASKNLRNDRVVRHLEQVAQLDPKDSAVAASVEILLDEGWRRDGLSAVAFLQDPLSLHVEGAAELALGR